jgi:hypothetical protein
LIVDYLGIFIRKHPVDSLILRGKRILFTGKRIETKIAGWPEEEVPRHMDILKPSDMAVSEEEVGYRPSLRLG